MFDYEHTQPGTLMRVILGLLVVIFIGAGVVLLVSGADIEEAVIPLAPAAVTGIVLALFHSLTVRVSKDEVALSFGVGLIQKSFDVNEIEAVFTVCNPWYYGWGVKKIPKGWLFNVSGLEAIELQMKNGRRYRIGTDEPVELVQAIETAVAECQ